MYVICMINVMLMNEHIKLILWIMIDRSPIIHVMVSNTYEGQHAAYIQHTLVLMTISLPCMC